MDIKLSASTSVDWSYCDICGRKVLNCDVYTNILKHISGHKYCVVTGKPYKERK